MNTAKRCEGSETEVEVLDDAIYFAKKIAADADNPAAVLRNVNHLQLLLESRKIYIKHRAVIGERASAKHECGTKPKLTSKSPKKGFFARLFS